MNKKINEINNKSLIKCFSICFLVFTILFTNTLVKSESSTNYTMYDKELYSLTNTYDYNNKIDYNENTVYTSTSPRYFMNSQNDRNKNIVENKTLLTVLTHGLSGSPSNYSSIDGKLGYYRFSILSYLCKKTDCNVYVALVGKENNQKVINLYNITDKVYQGISNDNKYIDEKVFYDCTEENKITKITDISKHSIVLFGGLDVYYGNTLVYEEFNYVVSKIILDMKELNDNKLFKINLIGHSRGGLTNMEYALDHPDLINQMFSFSTPYCSTTTGALDYNLLNSAIQSYESERDLVTKDVYTKYMNRWNDNYTKLGYDKIDITALGGYPSLELFMDLVCYKPTVGFINSLIDLDPITLNYLLNYISSFVSLTKLGIVGFNAIKIKTLINKICIKLSNEANDESGIDELLEILFTEINIDFKHGEIVMYNDGLVDILSQMGYVGNVLSYQEGYKGFKHVYKCFTRSNTNLEEIAYDGLSVIHMSVTRDNYLLMNVSKNITLDNN